MAASLPPLPFKAQNSPVTPPPDFQMFMKGPPPQFQAPYTQGRHQAMMNPSLQGKSAQAPQPQPRPPLPTPAPSNSDLTGPAPSNHPTDPAAAAAASAAAVDPRYIAMASRIASYYQQRCQAVANFQQQRCQAWANAQRQKCQEMMQAATVIVAWYIRDRISRRRKRQKRSFKRALSQRAAATRSSRGDGKITKGESVRRWVMNVPLATAAAAAAAAGPSPPPPPPPQELPVDQDEAAFDVDREPPADKDSQLFSVADNLIKSHLARVDIPLLGVLSFDESDSESESEYDIMDYEDELEEYEEEYEDDDGAEMPEDEERQGRPGGQEKPETAVTGTDSKHAHLGTTTKGSRKRSHSSIS